MKKHLNQVDLYTITRGFFEIDWKDGPQHIKLAMFAENCDKSADTSTKSEEKDKTHGMMNSRILSGPRCGERFMRRDLSFSMINLFILIITANLVHAFVKQWQSGQKMNEPWGMMKHWHVIWTPLWGPTNLSNICHVWYVSSHLDEYCHYEWNMWHITVITEVQLDNLCNFCIEWYVSNIFLSETYICKTELYACQNIHFNKTFKLHDVSRLLHVKVFGSRL